MLIIGSIIILSLSGPLLIKLFKLLSGKKVIRPQKKEKLALTWLDIIIMSFIGLSAIVTYVLTKDSSLLTRAFPSIVILIMLISIIGLAITSSYKQIFTSTKVNITKEIVFLGMILVLALLQYYLGFITVSVIFTFLFLLFYGKTKPISSTITAILVCLILLIGKKYLYLNYPEGILDIGFNLI